MTSADLAELVGPALASAFAARGYDTLTPVQEAVLDEALRDRDLRITSQTGSGKTVAIGLVLQPLLGAASAPPGPVARPAALVLAPTRELAKQVADELTWLFAPLGARIAAVTGGAGFAEQRRALSANPKVVVATPGRLRDALERGRIDASALAAVVLDEADSMLDLGFREDLDAILAMLPEERRSHLVSATFSRDVVALADRFQKDAVHVQGTRLGEANVDIEHVVHLVVPDQRVDALVNLLLSDEDAKSLVFARTRADVARIAGELAEAGFVVRTLSGEMEQPERDRALAAFRDGGVQALVATDVAARGIDVPDVARVIQVEPPANVETYTHRSGRTGRAGKQGTSVLFVSPAHYQAIARGLGRARIAHRIEPIPQPEEIQRAREEKLVSWLGRDDDKAPLDPNAVSIAERLLQSEAPARAIARLVVKAGLHGPTEARVVRVVTPPPVATRPGKAERAARVESGSRVARVESGSRVARVESGSRAAAPEHGSREHVSRDHVSREHVSREHVSRAGDRTAETHPQPRVDRAGAAAASGGDAWVPFRVTWGGLHGADPRRLLALACRRGRIRGADVGAIRVEATYSVVEVASELAAGFEAEAARPDPRDPRVRIERTDEPARGEVRARRAPHTAPPPPMVRRDSTHRAAPRDARERAAPAPRERALKERAPAPRRVGGHAPPRKR